MRAVHSILETIGNTPVIPLKRLVFATSAAVWGKYEAGNPSFSVKDRIAVALISKGEAEGKVRPGTIIVDATAGNTGVALALVCAVKKYRCVIFMPEDASLERRKMFEGFGAELKLTSKEEGIAGAVKQAHNFAAKTPNCFLPNQFENPETVEAHRRSTAIEILADFPNGVDALVVGVGTGGTLTGVGGELKKKFPKTQIIAVEPKSSAVISGGKPGRHKISQLGHGFVPKILDRSLIDEVIVVTDDQAYQTTRELSAKEGLLLGVSSGANVFAALAVAKRLGAGKKVLTFFCDAGQRYFSLEQSFKS